MGLKEWAEEYDKTIAPIQEERHCHHCGRRVNFNPYNGDSYRGCWCGLWWCCEQHALAEGWIWIGDPYETDHVSCDNCRKKD
jgi:hypothetical protein